MRTGAFLAAILALDRKGRLRAELYVFPIDATAHLLRSLLAER